MEIKQIKVAVGDSSAAGFIFFAHRRDGTHRHQF